MNNPIAHLNKVFDSRVRFGIMSTLLMSDEINFNELKELMAVTDGNLASHIRTLEDCGYLEVKKGFTGKKPHTTYVVTVAGEQALKVHLDALEKVIRSVGGFFLFLYFVSKSTLL
ncbi:transcriptional regulator [Filimonas lacunae]|uniref:Transcriptional regulator n=1 Tax=Filimonas lacunae TaxID=477680 RepID=A0A173MB74_9BACT|nr:transcriptional regulator [Filimonas lacunae]BAV04823.1 hypothetical protein FLA_0822 [Filimonas lacunae]SIT34708.1 transcriptional regulator [Filimonas lacunae]